MTFEKRLLRALELRGLKQVALARTLGISQQAVSGWINKPEKGGPESWRYPAIAVFLKVPLIWLMEGHGDPPPADDRHTEMERTLLELYKARAQLPDNPTSSPPRKKLRRA